MSATNTGIDNAACPGASAGQAAFGTATDAVRSLWWRLRMHLLIQRTRRITDGLEDHLRQDVGLGPRPAAAPRISPMATAWMR